MKKELKKNNKLVVFPLKSELTYFLDYFQEQKRPIEKTIANGHEVYKLPSLGVICVVGGHGKVQFGIQTQFFLSLFPEVSCVLCIGAGGGLSEKVGVLDIVLGQKTLEHDYKEKFDKTATLPVFDADENLLHLFSDISNFTFKVHTGIIASGDEDIIDFERARELYLNTDALSVAWEGVGGARAAAFNKKPFLEIRGITDNARNDVPESFAKNLPLVMKNMAKLLEAVFLDG